MKSLTKATVTSSQIESAVNRHFAMDVKRFEELNNGFYNISYLVVLEDDREVVMKIAPPNDVEILTYEIDIIKTELELYKLANENSDIKVPKILAEDMECDIISSPYYFMSKIDGIPLNKVNEISKDLRRGVYTTIAEYMAKLHNIKSDCYGYITMEEKCAGKDCLNSLIVSVEAVINDAHRKNIKLPFKEDEIINVFRNTQKAFDEIEDPVVCHFDLWDGNIFVKEDCGQLAVSGIIDFERGFYGCPAADFCQVAGYIDIEKQTYFFDVYNKYAHRKVKYDNAMKTRIMAYRFYLFLIMHVECDYRDVNGSFMKQKIWVAAKIKKAYRKLKREARKL